jgi:hypothetical protein
MNDTPPRPPWRCAPQQQRMDPGLVGADVAIPFKANIFGLAGEPCPDTWSRQGAARRPFHRRGAKVVGVPFTQPGLPNQPVRILGVLGVLIGDGRQPGIKHGGAVGVDGVDGPPGMARGRTRRARPPSSTRCSWAVARRHCSASGMPRPRQQTEISLPPAAGPTRPRRQRPAGG